MVISRQNEPRSRDYLYLTLIEWLQGFFIVHSTIDKTAHSRTLNSFFCELYMHNGRHSKPVPLSFVPQIDRMSHRGRPILYCQQLTSPGVCVFIKKNIIGTCPYNGWIDRLHIDNFAILFMRRESVIRNNSSKQWYRRQQEPSLLSQEFEQFGSRHMCAPRKYIGRRATRTRYPRALSQPRHQWAILAYIYPCRHPWEALQDPCRCPGGARPTYLTL